MGMTTANLILGKYNYSSKKNYNQVFDNVQKLDDADAFTTVLSVSSTKAAATVPSIKAACISNTSRSTIEVLLTYSEWKNNSNTDETNSVDTGGGSTHLRYLSVLLPAGDFFYLPHGRIIGYNEATSAANATTIDNATPDANMYSDSTANVDSATADGIVNSASSTTLYLEPYTSAANCAANLFKVGDLIRVDDEIMEVTAIGAKAALASNTLTVKRGVYGSTAATAGADGDPVRFAFFNTYQRFNKYSVCQTNDSGKFHAKNLFGYGRTLTGISDGIVPGSVAFKFFRPAYQTLGLTGITPASNTGLTASETYYLTIAVDGGSTVEISITMDASNTNFGGKNGFVSKLQEALNAKYYVAGGLFEKNVSVMIADGDIRFVSGSRLSTSAIALTAGTSGAGASVRLLAQQNGRIPALAGINDAIPAKLVDDEITDRDTSDVVKNNTGFMYDDGNGNLIGAGTGRINYETGEIDFTTLPNAEFRVSAAYLSAHSGGVNNSTATGKNTLQSIKARSVNSKLDASVHVVAYN